MCGILSNVKNRLQAINIVNLIRAVTGIIILTITDNFTKNKHIMYLLKEGRVFKNQRLHHQPNKLLLECCAG